MTKNLKILKDKPFLKDILDLLILAVITVLIGKLLTTIVLLPGNIDSGSMESTLMTGESILTDRLAYVTDNPKRGDVVVFYFPDAKRKCLVCSHTNSEPNSICNECGAEIKATLTQFVKRIIGLPGDTVTINNGFVYVNNVLLNEPYLNGITTNTGDGDYKVPDGHYFMLGDNRNNSSDSRKWINKYVPQEDILGRVFFKYKLSLEEISASTVHSYDDYNV